MMTPTRFLGSVLALLVCAAPRVVFAQDVAMAEALFNRGVEHMQRGRFAAGCPAIAESMKLDPLPGTQHTLADCLASAGKLVGAVEAYDEFLKMVEALPTWKRGRYLERVEKATQKKEELAPVIPRLTLRFPGGGARGVRVFLDDTEVFEGSRGVARLVDPGEHIVVMVAPGQPRVERQVTLAKGEAKTVDLDASNVPVETTREPFSRWYTRKPIAWVGSGVTVVGLGLGLGFTLGASAAIDRANARADAIRDQAAADPITNYGNNKPCGSPDTSGSDLPGYEAACDVLRKDIADYNTNATAATVGWVVFGVGAIGTGLFTLFDWYLPKKTSTTATNGPKVLAITPSFSSTYQGVGVVGTF
ncbi:hypothetical protein [Polyangium spumosum]|uniref:PEGA domain-containing protein n=1 Tax=Polyangium spumosum TaxID=889282 RepID=A0A6N7PXX8_9BACT|nr:hypothetical protein [Polyangium spumosum]MRG96407.1 hypothetical protein [Polyangium spumosum]